MCTRTKEKGAVTPQETDSDSPECSGVSDRGVGHWWPAAGLGVLSARVCAWNLLKQVAMIFITSTIVWLLVKQQGGNTAPPINRKLDSRFTKYGPAHQKKTQFPLSQSLPSGSFKKPLILLHQRADRKTTTVTEN